MDSRSLTPSSREAAALRAENAALVDRVQALEAALADKELVKVFASEMVAKIHTANENHVHFGHWSVDCPALRCCDARRLLLAPTPAPQQAQEPETQNRPMPTYEDARNSIMHGEPTSDDWIVYHAENDRRKRQHDATAYGKDERSGKHA